MAVRWPSPNLPALSMRKMLTEKFSGLGSMLHHSFIGALTGSGRAYIGKQLSSLAIGICALADIVTFDRKWVEEDVVVMPANRNRTASNAMFASSPP